MKFEGCLESEFVFPEDGFIVIDSKPYPKAILREVIGLDEEAISQPQFKDDPPAMVIELLFRTISEVPGCDKLPLRKDIKSLPIGVLDSMVLALRRVSLGDDILVKADCPNKDCNDKVEAMVNAEHIKFKEGSFKPRVVTLTRGVMVEGKKLKKVTLRPPDGFVQAKFFKAKDFTRFGEMNTDLIHACIVNIDGAVVGKEVVYTMARIDRKELSQAIQDFPGLDTAAALTCGKCGEKFEAQIVILDFLA
jgi:hypothetical protein